MVTSPLGSPAPSLLNGQQKPIARFDRYRIWERVGAVRRDTDNSSAAVHQYRRACGDVIQICDLGGRIACIGQGDVSTTRSPSPTREYQNWPD